MMVLPDDDPDGPGAVAEINTTPLIDVMLVLLVMLIITIPIQTHAVKLDLAGDTPSATDTPPPPVSVEIAADGTIRWNHQPVADRADLDSRLRGLIATPTQPDLQVRPNPQAPYGQVAAVLAAAERQGVARLGIMGSE